MAPELTPSRCLDSKSLARVEKLRKLPEGAHIHISGVCGTGTAAVLCLLKQLGYRVSGSDKAFYPPMGAVVKETADRVFEGYSAENLAERPDLVVIGNALSRGNPEVEYVLDQEIPFASMPEVFAALLIGSREECPCSIVVTGTHGKTTTSAAVAHLIDSAGRKPGYFVGGMPYNLEGSIRPVSKEIPLAQRVVVLEGDEYDSAFFAKYSKFHSYRPDLLIVSSLEFDHADIFNSLDDIKNEFTKLAARVPKEGLILICDQGEELRKLSAEWESSSEIAARIQYYGESEESSYRLLSRSPWPFQQVPKRKVGQELVLEIDGEQFRVCTELSGRHNALNLLACAAAAWRQGIGEREIIQGILDFKGVKRRGQVIYDDGKLVVLEDFAHHPTAVQTTLEGLKESYPEKRLVAVFEPRSNTSRRSFFQEGYANSFSAADVVVMLEVLNRETYSATDAEVIALDVEKIISEIAAGGKTARSFSSAADIESYLLDTAAKGDLVVLMSNGDFSGLPQSLIASLQKAGSSRRH